MTNNTLLLAVVVRQIFWLCTAAVSPRRSSSARLNISAVRNNNSMFWLGIRSIRRPRVQTSRVQSAQHRSARTTVETGEYTRSGVSGGGSWWRRDRADTQGLAKQTWTVIFVNNRKCLRGGIFKKVSWQSHESSDKTKTRYTYLQLVIYRDSSFYKPADHSDKNDAWSVLFVCLSLRKRSDRIRTV